MIRGLLFLGVVGLVASGTCLAQRLEPLREPCITGSECHCPCTWNNQHCKCKKKCGPGENIKQEPVP